MLTEDDVKRMLESFDETFDVLDEEQRKIDNYRKVRKGDVEFQASLVHRQDELNFVRGELVKRYARLKELT